MKVRVSMSNMPGEPLMRTLDVGSSLEAAREILNSDEMTRLWERRLDRGAGWLIISAMPVKEKTQAESTDATQRVPTSGEALTLQ